MNLNSEACPLMASFPFFMMKGKYSRFREEVWHEAQRAGGAKW
jgi:hypothetical protein